MLMSHGYKRITDASDGEWKKMTTEIGNFSEPVMMFVAVGTCSTISSIGMPIFLNTFAVLYPIQFHI